MFAVAALTCGYVATSLFLLKNPQILHSDAIDDSKQQRIRDQRREERRRFPRCVHIAHRGGAAEGYENTLETFRRAVQDTNTDMLELDCQLTKDKVVIVSHDANLKRACGVDVDVSSLDYSDLPRMMEKVPIDFMPGLFFVGNKNDDRRIPTLEEVFATFPNTPINIDIKTHNMDLIKGVDTLIRKYDRAKTTVWGNFKSETTDACYKTNPEVGIFFSFPRVLKLLGLYYSGLLPFVSLRETHLEIPIPSVTSKNDIHEYSRLKALVVSLLDKILMQKSLFRHLESRGIQVYVWVLNDEAEFRRAFECGVTGVMTDYPSKLRSFLDCNLQYAK